MRIKSIIAAAAAVSALGLISPQSASAFDRCGRDVVTGADPCAYRYQPRGYYPYYNSGYWVPRAVYKRPHDTNKTPRSQQAWGYPKYGYDNASWHYRKYGHIWHHHW